MFRRRRKVECFFCGDKLELLSANHSFKGKQTAERIAVGSANEYWCSSCGETTTLQHGVIVPDQAAHHDSSLNEESFSRRGEREPRKPSPAVGIQSITLPSLLHSYAKQVAHSRDFCQQSILSSVYDESGPANELAGILSRRQRFRP